MKKVSLFFATPIRKQMETSDGFVVINHAVKKAIMLNSELLCVTLRGNGLSENQAKEVGGNTWKFFSSGCTEFKEIQGVIRVAYRMESTIKPYVGDDGLILLEVQLYRKNAKKAFFSIQFFITLVTGYIYGAKCNPPCESHLRPIAELNGELLARHAKGFTPR